MSRRRFLDAIRDGGHRCPTAYGSGTSIACQELMERTGAWFPEAHLDAEKMAALAHGRPHAAWDSTWSMPLFSVCHEAAAMGCNVNWGGPDAMPESGKPIFHEPDDIRIPADLLHAARLRGAAGGHRAVEKAAGRRRGGLRQGVGQLDPGYHYFGVENFLIGTLDDPDATRRILDRLLPVTLQFAQAQIDAGADCILLADHATRDLCSPRMYRDFLLPLHRRLAAEIKAPVILHICGNTADRIGMVAQTGLSCFHWDTKTGTPDEVRALAGPRLALMGGISNFTLLRGTPEVIAADSALRGEASMSSAPSAPFRRRRR